MNGFLWLCPRVTGGRDCSCSYRFAVSQGRHKYSQPHKVYKRIMKEKIIYFIRNYPILFIGFGIALVIFCGALYGRFTENRANREYDR